LLKIAKFHEKVNAKYAAICRYTQQKLESCFAEGILIKEPLEDTEILQHAN
jgi:hypothetical protein